jgi:hypothetical protein
VSHPPGGHAARRRGELRGALVTGPEVPPGGVHDPRGDRVHPHRGELRRQRGDDALDRAVHRGECDRAGQRGPRARRRDYEIGNRSPAFVSLLRALMAEAQLDPEFGTRFRAAFLERRRDALAVITGRARDRGDLPDRPDPGTVADIVFGTIWYRILATRRPFDAGLEADLLDVLAPATDLR